MHSILKKELKNLKSLAVEKDVVLSFLETSLEEVAFVCSGKRLVCLVLKEGKVHYSLTCYKVNLKKWKWAEQEGFETEEQLGEVIDQILEQFKTPDQYLKYLKL
tara:strand:- start:1726 stop:2037 length:312 start_codon:yes stop_codon:yes gene_type:complete